jgi:nucleoside-triphosphatase THEP1
MITIVTGAIDSGKTRYLKELYDKDPTGDGIISLKYFKDGCFRGYDILHLKSGEKKEFIRLKTNLPVDWNEQCQFGKYSFSKQGFTFAENVLNEIKDGPIYIDEIGPLEIVDKKGFYNTVKKMIYKEIDLYLTVRTTLLDALHDEFGLTLKTKIITLK